jgi:hypothetical protein
MADQEARSAAHTPPRGGYHRLRDHEPRQEKACSWCGNVKMCLPGERAGEFPPSGVQEVWCCDDCLTPAQRKRVAGRREPRPALRLVKS